MYTWKNIEIPKLGVLTSQIISFTIWPIGKFEFCYVVMETYKYIYISHRTNLKLGLSKK